MLTINHNFVSAKIDGNDATLVRPSNWNDTHAVTGTPETVVTKTSNYTVVVADNNSFFTNTGAIGTVNFTLPTPALGLIYTFYVDAAFTVQVTTPSGTIQVAASVSSSAGNVTNAVSGGCLKLVAISSTKWVTASSVGTWTTH